MTGRDISVGTRSSRLATWQATHVQEALERHGFRATLKFIKSEGDIDLRTPLYEMGVQGIFTHTLDVALLNERIDLAVHSMKDVPTRLPEGLVAAAVLPRATPLDVLVPRGDDTSLPLDDFPAVIATSSTRRRAQWLHRYPHHQIENLRGNVNSRMQKLADSQWYGAIFAAAGLDRIDIRPDNAIELDWMLPAPAQGAILVVCRAGDDALLKACSLLNDPVAALCTGIEKDFLRTLRGGCTAPVGALAEVRDGVVYFKGNLLYPDGTGLMETELSAPLAGAADLGSRAGAAILERGGDRIIEQLHNA